MKLPSNALLLLAAICFSHSGTVTAQECSSTNPTKCDTHERCPVWRAEGECLRNRRYMKQYCPVSCEQEHKDVAAISSNDGTCIDKHPQCEDWAKQGECESNVDMLRFCRKSCDRCDTDACKDDHGSCEFWASHGECENNPRYMKDNCQKSCKVCTNTKQTTTTVKAVSGDKTAVEETSSFGQVQVAEGASYTETMDIIEASIKYMATANIDDNVRKLCVNKDELCSFWNTIGECENNEDWMYKHCGPACNSCHLPISWV